jgi:hypothetical protein
VFITEFRPTFQRYVLPPLSERWWHRPDDGGSTYLLNVGRHSVNNTAVHPRRFWVSYSPPWELEVSQESNSFTKHVVSTYLSIYLGLHPWIRSDSYIEASKALVRHVTSANMNQSASQLCRYCVTVMRARSLSVSEVTQIMARKERGGRAPYCLQKQRSKLVDPTQANSLVKIYLLVMEISPCHARHTVGLTR